MKKSRNMKLHLLLNLRAIPALKFLPLLIRMWTLVEVLMLQSPRTLMEPLLPSPILKVVPILVMHLIFLM